MAHEVDAFIIDDRFYNQHGNIEVRRREARPNDVARPSSNVARYQGDFSY